MSKAFLVFDMPKSCKECKLHEMASNFNEHLCAPTQKTHDKFANKKPDWCPLRPVPEKHKELSIEEYEFGKLGLAFTQGWNSCINEILGE